MTLLGPAMAEALTRVARGNPGCSAVRILWTELLFAWRDALASPSRPAPWVTLRR